MKCVVPGGNVKILAKAVHMLAKIGDEIYVNPQQEAISFRTVNMAKSAYSDFTFYKNFFSYYTLGDLAEEEAQKCKISMRSAMTVFKFANALDKQVETCHICLEVDACNLVFILKYKNGINKSHLSPILDCEKLQASYSKAEMHNELASQARVLVDALQNFPQSLIEITLEITPNKVLLRNYVDDSSVMVNTTRTQLALSVGEFDRCIVGNETTITFCLKEVRAFLTFSESAGVPITVNFETTGKPMLLALRAPSFEANLLLSTLSLDSDSQSESSVATRQIQPVRRKNTSSRSISRRGRKASNQVKRSIVPTKSPNNTFRNKSPEEENRMVKTLNQTRNSSANIIFAKTNKSTDDGQERNHRSYIEQNQNKIEQNRLLTVIPASTSSITSKNQMDKTLSQINTNNSTNIVFGKTHNFMDRVQERNLKKHRKLVKSVFSTITKRKSTCDENYSTEEDPITEEYSNLDESVSRSLSSSSKQVAKKAKVVFQKCFQTTFDPRMLPGHDVVLVGDSDENSD
ncbi:cell cycle checkpoint control protein RAD9A isoform X2 [Pseudomyrmex gracilis]|uniref:cell cycle checkpoint control protein RAD9A isoform X2 n=1 Tax=Pseudomyrmex gracilis TaxID=219809 RepID=UPI000994EDE4|nr:cell cycle checkpoint control protein RAD9A isoform X2 [Pseudomyrmex gracilis]